MPTLPQQTSAPTEPASGLTSASGLSPVSGNDGLGFTPAQIADWKRFEKVRKGGRYNMFDSRARAATGLSTERYRFVMKHFSALKNAADAA